MQRTLDKQRILITGGGTGLGAEMAKNFVSRGAEVIICGRRSKPLEDTANQICKANTTSSIETHVCDIRDPDAVERMFEIIEAEGGIDGLVNNAAATFLAQTHTLSHRAFDAILATTLHGTIYCTLAAGKKWIDRKREGVIVSILSPTVRNGRPFTVPSVVAKTGALAMTRSLAAEWGQYRIRLVGVEPGAFPTSGASKQLGGKKREAPEKRVPLGRVGRYKEITGLVAYLLSSEASYITGESIAIDGGAHLRTAGAEDLWEWTEEDWSQIRQSRAK